MPIDGDLWRGRRVLLTGHTGFKGAWLSLWLQQLGAELTGLAPGPPSRPSLYELARIADGMAAELAVDVRDATAMRTALAESRPEVVLHLAAQPMVRRSLIDPVGTYEVNVMGTINVLDAVRHAGGCVRAVVVVTSDKCYENDGSLTKGPFREGDPLGGSDPYSSSKACAELVAAAYGHSFFDAPDAPRLATARAGNVIGGGDWGEDRLLPDAVRVATGLAPAPLRLRNPDAVRPWQHVLNPLSGYLLLAQELLRSRRGCGAWNFGPPHQDARPVGWIVERLRELWDGAPAWQVDQRPNPPEAGRLELDSSRARELLGWESRWDLERGLAELVRWHVAQVGGQDMRAVSLEQLEQFLVEGERLPVAQTDVR
ncbi:MAG TPA: CDP-glucose 4,6-dehydratase [Solirubrobacteraceae bacterium]|jgi:CDP-glucose 4,6-dehydratase